MIFVSGQIPASASGEILSSDSSTIGERARQCIENLRAILVAAGSSLERTVRVGVFLTSMDSFAEVNAEYEKWFTHRPARTCVAVKQLPKGVDVEIECVALP